MYDGFYFEWCLPLEWYVHKYKKKYWRISIFIITSFKTFKVKLTSRCPTWWNLTALPTHYESQCIPTPLAYFAFQQPSILQKLSVAGTFFIEIGLVFLFFAPTQSLRKFTAFHQIFFMITIMLTGNYNFFNLLYIGLCISLFDDSWFRSGAKVEFEPVWSKR